ncbi:hypothetical protein JKP88DRAFT_158804 [Tribonema minus]|uniref:Uncharacterized protein n=1 Tax=Tribonema minus TaxID=303371 RepID=A0A835YP98_9STRA|nr:hypothetical protein JKP88DRAFT_158804 [Tribonema minus]
MPRKLPDLLSKFPKIEPLTSRYLSRVPTICTAVGGTGSGKTFCLVALIKLMRREKSITHLFIISPTAHSNTIYRAIFDPETDQLFDDLGVKVFDTLRQIQDTMNGIADGYETQLRYALAFERFVRGEDVSTTDEQLLEEGGYRKIAVRRPSFALLIDDAQNSAIFSRHKNNGFPNLVLRSRHCARGLGCSIFMAAQTMKNGVPRSLRTNSTHFMMFKTCSASEMDSLYEEVAGFVSRPEFERLYALYTHGKHGYLFADMIENRLSDSF